MTIVDETAPAVCFAATTGECEGLPVPFEILYGYMPPNVPWVTQHGCTAHREMLREELHGATCNDCDVVLRVTDRYAAVDHTPCLALLRMTTVTSLRTYWSDPAAVRMGDETFSVGNLSLVIGDGDYAVCTGCGVHYNGCNDCGDVYHNEDLVSCDGCSEVYLCENCSFGHTGCDDYYEDDYEDSPATTERIIAALAAPAVPGRLVVSPRAFGVEIETGASGDVYGARERLYQMARDGAPVLLTDHSEHCGHEFVTLPMRGRTGEDRLAAMYRVLGDHRCTPNSNCGTHFHLDMSNERSAARNRALAALRMVEPVIYAMTLDRESSQWCVPSERMYRKDILALLDDAATAVLAPGQSGRYCVVNSHALAAHGTIEIRALDGTRDVERVLTLIAFCAGVVDYAVASTAHDLRRFVIAPERGRGATKARALLIVDEVAAAGHITADVARTVALAAVGLAEHRGTAMTVRASVRDGADAFAPLLDVSRPEVLALLEEVTSPAPTNAVEALANPAATAVDLGDDPLTALLDGDPGWYDPCPCGNFCQGVGDGDDDDDVPTYEQAEMIG